MKFTRRQYATCKVCRRAVVLRPVAGEGRAPSWYHVDWKQWIGSPHSVRIEPGSEWVTVPGGAIVDPR